MSIWLPYSAVRTHNNNSIQTNLNWSIGLLSFGTWTFEVKHYEKIRNDNFNYNTWQLRKKRTQNNNYFNNFKKSTTSLCICNSGTNLAAFSTTIYSRLKLCMAIIMPYVIFSYENYKSKNLLDIIGILFLSRIIFCQYSYYPSLLKYKCIDSMPPFFLFTIQTFPNYFKIVH